MAEVPTGFVGAWRRTQLLVGDSPRDDADVLWLQGAEWYADVRIPHRDPGGAVEAFAGPAAWAAPHFTWTHDLDWLGSFPADVGHLDWDGDDLIETGVFEIDATERPYSERWVRGPVTRPRTVATSSGSVALVAIRVGADAIVMASRVPPAGGSPDRSAKLAESAESAEPAFAVRRDRWDEGGPTEVFGRAVGRPPLPPFPFDRPWSVGDRLTYDGIGVEVIDVG